ncbi:MAG: phenylacetic acid degradation protein [Sphingobacteriales bacterium UTBCD1]|jgi:ring-1,2-phenylacetyl-CoA epoxidase subunit PaaE|nr:MAG: phenylacetic acid degradation protein [Sphingobacteriales bacterium UTBCD1]
MSLHFHTLRVKEVRKETPECVSVLFEVPGEKRESFSFIQGQSLTMRAFLNGEEVRRTYSICGSPLDHEYRVAIKKQEYGLFSTFANEQLKAGDTLEVMEPVGKFYSELNPSYKKNYLAFAAGSGITPVISIIKTTLRTEPESRFTLVYGNRNRVSIIFLDELEGLKNMFMDRFSLMHILSQEQSEIPVNYGRIGIEKLDELSKIIDYGLMNDIFICGPEEMIFTVKNHLLNKNINEKKIHFELFTTSDQRQKPKVKVQQAKKEGAPASKISIKLEGSTFEVEIPESHDTVILDAALEQGIDAPYSCKGGMCCTCKAKLLEGEVSMDVHWGLEDDEVRNGFILTCQSHPKTRNVKIDYDIK